MTFYISSGAVLLGSTRPEDYPEKMPAQTAAVSNRRSLIFADGADDLKLDGGGIIDGQGQQLPMRRKRAIAALPDPYLQQPPSISSPFNFAKPQDVDPGLLRV